jgi:hypothetical protein
LFELSPRLALGSSGFGKIWRSWQNIAMAPTTPESSGQLASRRRRGRYAETAFEEVIEANRRGTWTINALSLTTPTVARVFFFAYQWI